MRATRLTILVFLATAAILGCASSSTPSRGVAQSSRDRITSMEIQATSGASAFDLVTKLRPHWLRQTGTASIGSGVRHQVTLVYLDGNRIGGLDALRSITSGGITAMEWIPATRAAIVLPDIGNEPIAGVISISTRPLT